MSTRYLITAPWVMSHPEKLIANGAVFIEGSRIVQVAPEHEISAESLHGCLRIFQKDCLLMPGLVNAHCHLELTGLADLCPDPGTVDFIDWIISVITTKKKTLAETFKTGIGTGLQLLLESGTTCVGDLRSPEIFQASDIPPSIVRAVHFLEIIGQDTSKQLQLLELPAFTSTASAEEPLVKPGIAPHSPYTVSLALLEQLITKAEKLELPVTMHLGESIAEELFFRTGRGAIVEQLYPYVHWQNFIPPAYGRDSIDVLLEKQLIHTLSAVHLGTARPEQLKRFSRLSITPILCPRSNQTLGNPLPDLPAILDAGLLPALGTDSLTSVKSLNLWDEMRSVAEIFPAVPAKNILKMATMHGAVALGLKKKVGQLETGYEADLIAVRIPATQQAPDLDKLIQTTEKRDVRMVMVGGKMIQNNV